MIKNIFDDFISLFEKKVRNKSKKEIINELISEVLNYHVLNSTEYFLKVNFKI